MDALLVRVPWINMILDGSKTWEIRGRRTHKRGLIALVQSGTGTVVGLTELVGVVGPLGRSDFAANAHQAGISNADASRGLPYSQTFAWIFSNSRRLSVPVSYCHPRGAVIWVTLESSVERAILRQLT